MGVGFLCANTKEQPSAFDDEESGWFERVFDYMSRGKGEVSLPDYEAGSQEFYFASTRVDDREYVVSYSV
ncbi:hypothetical protein [Corynebacterium glutamicum]|uniref:hypothetical protein n=1 Tax=Corynebacterium glutamicum TaxID=1718 RepID=UPI001E346AC8|nr:hypothetical protein [Corynebacterium glutamicum]